MSDQSRLSPLLSQLYQQAAARRTEPGYGQLYAELHSLADMIGARTRGDFAPVPIGEPEHRMMVVFGGQNWTSCPRLGCAGIVPP